MLTAIGKFSKSFLLKVFVGIIILPFVFWGMGDVFRGGNQNVIVTIDSKKISTQEFLDYLSMLNLNNDQVKNLKKTDLLEKILSEFIGKKIMALEIEELKISINDNSLRKIIKNDELFFKDNKFSRTEYEKFLIKSGVSAPNFEKNIMQQEKRRQFLSYLSGGIIIPEELVKKEYRKEHQTKTIQYIDLEEYHINNKPSEKNKKELYERNKDIFFTEYKTLRFSEITPQKIVGKNEYDETFFNQLNLIENNVLDGQSFDETTQNNNLDIVFIKKINAKKENNKKQKIENLSNNLFKKIYNIKSLSAPEVFNIDNKYYLAEITNIEKKKIPYNDTQVQEALFAQLNFENMIKNNTSIVKEISMGAFDKQKFLKFSKDNNLEIKDYKISNLKQNEIFPEGIIKRIFLTKDGQIDLITNNTLSKNFLIFAVKTDYKDLKKNSNEYEQYEAKARLNIINQIYMYHDSSLNKKYKVELNKRAIDRVKNSF